MFLEKSSFLSLLINFKYKCIYFTFFSINCLVGTFLVRVQRVDGHENRSRYTRLLVTWKTECVIKSHNLASQHLVMILIVFLNLPKVNLYLFLHNCITGPQRINKVQSHLLCLNYALSKNSSFLNFINNFHFE